MVRPKGTGGQARELTREEIVRLDRCLTGTTYEERNRALLWLGLGSGMRIAEMVGLRVRDVAPYGRILDFIQLEKHSTKSGRSRVVHLSKQAVVQLESYLKPRGYLSKKQQDRLNDPLFPSPVGLRRPLRSGSAIEAFTRMCREAGISGASTHSLRRTHANALRRRGVDLKIIQEQLGHASLATTERYFIVDPLEKARAVADLKF